MGVKIHLSKLLGERKMTMRQISVMTGIRPNTISNLYYETAKRIEVQLIAALHTDGVENEVGIGCICFAVLFVCNAAVCYLGALSACYDTQLLLVDCLHKTEEIYASGIAEGSLVKL